MLREDGQIKGCCCGVVEEENKLQTVSLSISPKSVSLAEAVDRAAVWRGWGVFQEPIRIPWLICCAVAIRSWCGKYNITTPILHRHTTFIQSAQAGACCGDEVLSMERGDRDGEEEGDQGDDEATHL